MDMQRQRCEEQLGSPRLQVRKRDLPHGLETPWEPKSDGTPGPVGFLVVTGFFSCSPRDPNCVCVCVGYAEALLR